MFYRLLLSKIIHYFELKIKWKILESTIQFFGYL